MVMGCCTLWSLFEPLSPSGPPDIVTGTLFVRIYSPKYSTSPHFEFSSNIEASIQFPHTDTLVTA